MPNHFTLTFFLLRRRDESCSHSNRDLFTCEDNMLFSHVKISCFRAKAHLVFHWYLYNKYFYVHGKLECLCSIRLRVYYICDFATLENRWDELDMFWLCLCWLIWSKPISQSLCK